MDRSKIRRFIVILVASLVLPLFVAAQTDGGGGGTNTEATKTPDSKLERKKAKRLWKENRKQQMNDAKAKKEYNKKNTKKTRKRMKQSEKKAAKNNAHKRDFFLVRWWRKIFH